MNAGLPLSKDRNVTRREDSSADRKNLVLPKLLPDAFSLSSYGRKFSTRAESLEKRRGVNNSSTNNVRISRRKHKTHYSIILLFFCDLL
jgi:hypothetical protein